MWKGRRTREVFSEWWSPCSTFAGPLRLHCQHSNYTAHTANLFCVKRKPVLGNFVFPSKGKDIGEKFGCHLWTSALVSVRLIIFWINCLIFYLKKKSGKSYANGKEKRERLAQLVLAECELVSLCVLGGKDIMFLMFLRDGASQSPIWNKMCVML